MEQGSRRRRCAAGGISQREISDGWKTHASAPPLSFTARWWESTNPAWEVVEMNRSMSAMEVLGVPGGVMISLHTLVVPGEPHVPEKASMLGPPDGALPED